jgi:phenylpyruvate tautomerase PptA (4-oxalocrotonate tautomerase family)
VSTATEEINNMPMIDVYATAGTFTDKHQLAADDSLSNVNGDNTYVRVQVLTNDKALDRDKQLTVVDRLTTIISAAAGDPTLTDRTWVLLTEATPGGWGLHGHAHTNDELVLAARAEITAAQRAQETDSQRA